MNDLKLLTALEKKLNVSESIAFISFDINMSVLYATDHDKIYGIDSNDLNNVTTFDLNAENVSNSIDKKLISFQFLTESNNIALINTKGDLYILNVFLNEFEGVGTIPDGIAAAEWSPDQELLVLLTVSDGLILMTKDFDILNEQTISIQNKVDLEYINVGWGSFETQFKGSAGKNFVKDKGEEKLLDWDERMGSICWRTDGEYFIVSFVETSAKSRKFQIFTRESILHSTIENDINVLDSPIAWKYSKSLIAGSIYRFNRHEIIFFERNGLAHGGFQLPFACNQMKVNDILWNIDSSILCVWSERLDNNDKNGVQSVVQLWTMANYHWYLKQSYNFNMSNKVTSVSWDPEDNYSLHLFTSSGQYIKYKLGMTTNYCSPALDYNASISVIDGHNLLITPFKNKIIPPPMSLHKLVASSPVNNVAWSSHNMDLLALLMSGELVYFKYSKNFTEDKKEKETYSLIPTKFDIKNLKNYSGSIQHIEWINKTDVIIVADTIDTGLNLMLFQLNEIPESYEFIEQKRIILEFSPLNISYNRVSNKLALQSPTGLFVKYDMAFNFLDELKFPQPCPVFKFITIKDSKQLEREVYIGSTQYYRLYVDGIEIANNCNSFFVHDEFLLFTGHTNTLKFVNLEKMKDSSSKIVQEEAIRKLERGAKLVSAIHSDTACILQMPRGNLETIHPRTLLISKLKRNIDNQLYLKAIESMRKHRINMNILFDHNPENFLNNLSIFVKQIDSANLLNLFLTELNEDDSTATFYRDYYEQKAPVKKDLNSNVISEKYPEKLNKVCSKLIKICEELDADKYFLVILSCYAKMKELEKGLYRICQLKSANTSKVDEGLRHLLYIVDVNEMFDVALGTYDFEIVLMVAEKSHKDPKEYLPFLNDLKKLEENYMKYKIDLYLKRYKKALQSVVKCGPDYYDEIVKLVDDYKLYTEGLKYFKTSDELFKRISKCFATHLSGKKYYEEAGLVLFRASSFTEAMEAFYQSSNWQMYINVCYKLNIKGSELLEKLNHIIDKLKNEMKFLECATIYEKYLNDPESSIMCLIDGSLWQQAITSIHKFDRFDFFETNLIPALKTSQQDVLCSIEEYHSKFVEKRDRLEEVRIEKAKQREREENEFEDELRANDNQSVSDMSNSTFDNQSSVGSTRSYASTVNTQFSSKSSKKKRSRRSLISLKKGSPYEDLALIQDLHETITQSQSFLEGVSSLSKALLLFNMNDLCIVLQNKYEQLMDMIEKNISMIWDYDMNDKDESLSQSFMLKTTPTCTTEFIKLDAKYRFPPVSVSKRQWKLHFYE